jgi:hypothetical protein
MKFTNVQIRSRSISLLLSFQTIPTMCTKHNSRNPDKITAHSAINHSFQNPVMQMTKTTMLTQQKQSSTSQLRRERNIRLGLRGSRRNDIGNIRHTRNGLNRDGNSRGNWKQTSIRQRHIFGTRLSNDDRCANPRIYFRSFHAPHPSKTPPN